MRYSFKNGFIIIYSEGKDFLKIKEKNKEFIIKFSNSVEAFKVFKNLNYNF